MKNIRPELVSLFKEGYCTPQISRISKTIEELSTTIHHSVKKLESECPVRVWLFSTIGRSMKDFAHLF